MRAAGLGCRSENHRPPPRAGHPMPPTMQLIDERLAGVIARMCSSKRNVTSRSTPSAASAVNFSRQRVSRGGAPSGSMNSLELGSNTSTVAGSLQFAARCFTALIMC